MKKKLAACSNGDGAKPKERHIVSWSQEEDDILRQQISIHGTDKWFTYLNSDFKKGGWSPEEDMLLCEAQKIFGNRWTEIAKVVSGRTDNAVKNRFTTLCKKKAKHEALAKENSTSYINLNNKRIIFPDRLDIDRICDVSEPMKKLRRSHISDVPKTGNTIESSVDDCANKPLRHPFAVLAQNFHDVAGENILSHQHVNNLKETSENANNNKSQGTFLKKNDPKINVLMQQAELLSSLALKVNSENTNQSLENAWKVLQDFLHQMKEGDMLKFQFPTPGHDTHKILITDSSINEGSQPYKRQPALSEESGGSSEYSTGSTLLSRALGNKTEESQVKPCVHDQDIEFGLRNSQIGGQTGVQESENGIWCDLSLPDADTTSVRDEMKTNHGSATAEREYPKGDFSSPLQVTPQFRSLAAAIPSPKFSESVELLFRGFIDFYETYNITLSIIKLELQKQALRLERRFLLKTLGVESTPPHLSTQPPSCKRALLQSL
ncbi:hypothetical protein HAX54_003271 [Datura stramonium]|uniref:Uncharacterized protein n=1 Tax=Datura stramonium TaxID=4076 RepID=A0ABS8T6B2_DATST|nr:hypothetical protein [Datura stramonium]